MRDVSIVGLGQTPVGEHWDTSLRELGFRALEAALNPSEHGDLFFVADGTGGHIFSATLKDHNAAVANWRKTEKEIRARQAASGQDAPGRAQPVANPVTELPNPPAEDAPAGAAGAKAQPVAAKGEATPAAATASTVPPPVRKPKKP